MTNKTQILAELDTGTAKKFKAKLALDGLTYKDWLTTRVKAYLATRTVGRK